MSTRSRRRVRRVKFATAIGLVMVAIVSVPRVITFLFPETRCVVLVDRSASVDSDPLKEEYVSSLRQVLDGCRRKEARTRIHFFGEAPLSAQTVTLSLKFDKNWLANPTTGRSGSKDVARVIAAARQHIGDGKNEATNITEAFKLAERDFEGARGGRYVAVLTDGIQTVNPNLTGLEENESDIDTMAAKAQTTVDVHLGGAKVYFVGVGRNDDEPLSGGKQALIDRFWRMFVTKCDGDRVAYEGRLVTFP